MTTFLTTTVQDLRGGRQSWRVVLACCAPSFLIALTFSLLHRV